MMHGEVLVWIQYWSVSKTFIKIEEILEDVNEAFFVLNFTNIRIILLPFWHSIFQYAGRVEVHL